MTGSGLSEAHPAPTSDGDLPPLVYLLSTDDDEETAKKLRKHLQGMENAGLIRVVVNGDVVPGRSVSATQKARMEEATVIVPLVSASLLARFSELFAPGKNSTAALAPVRINPCSTYGSPLENCAMLPARGYATSDQAQAEVAEALLMMTRALPKKARNASVSPEEPIYMGHIAR